MQACCTAESLPFWAMPSMVVICLPATALTGIEQERIATPSTCTVQAPHWAMPQPYLVPVMPIVSRNTQSSGVASSTSALWDWPLMDSEIILNPPIPSLSTRRIILGAGGARLLLGHQAARREA